MRITGKKRAIAPPKTKEVKFDIVIALDLDGILKVISRLKKWGRSPLFWVLTWTIVAALLRFSFLGAQPPWTDECATIAFSLGNSFRTIPLDRALSAETLVRPLQASADAGLVDTLVNLLRESTHPPAYFLLNHLWLRLFSSPDRWGNVAVARSLAAAWGVASVPAVFWMLRRSVSAKTAGLAAGLMALSPFGTFLGREARHYTLAIFLLVLSLGFLLRAIACLRSGLPGENLPAEKFRQRPLSPLVARAWVLTNALGVATHYFFALCLAAQGLVLAWIWWTDTQRRRCSHPLSETWRQMYTIALGNFTTTLLWMPLWFAFRDSNLTSWVVPNDPLTYEPIARLAAWWTTVLALPPADLSVLPLGSVIASVGLLAVYLVWLLPGLWRGVRLQLRPARGYSDREWQNAERSDGRQQESTRLALQVLGGYAIGAIALTLLLTYGFGKDLTLAPRFSFITFPAAIAIAAIALGSQIDAPARAKSMQVKSARKKRIWMQPTTVLLVALLGSLTVVAELGYLQHHRSRPLAEAILEASDAPLLVASTHKHHGDTGRLMGLAWSFRYLRDRDRDVPPARYLLAHKGERDPAVTLQEVANRLPRPFDLWGINFHAPVELDKIHCEKDKRTWPHIEGYRIRHYRCREAVKPSPAKNF